jgi:hypothetical protein
MTDLKKEIPQQAFINAEILQIAESTGNFHQAMQEITQKYGLSGYVYKNPAYIVSLLYCLIVVPKEIFAEGNEEAINRRIAAREMASLFTFKIDEPKFDRARNKELRTASDDAFLIRRIRNSLAHVNYEVDESMTFTFRDKFPNSTRWEFEVTIGRDNLMKFLSKLGADLANLRTNPL